MSACETADFALRITARQQMILAGLVSNSQTAAALLEPGGETLIDAQEDVLLHQLFDQSRPALTQLAVLISSRRFNRASALLPASRQLLGDRFALIWPDYLASVEPGVPTATLEAYRFARFLIQRLDVTAVARDVLRYEQRLNELAWRLKTRPQATGKAKAKLRSHDIVRMSRFVFVEPFSCDVAPAVMALKRGATLPAFDGAPCALLFRAGAPTGVAVDVARLPDLLADALLSLGDGAVLANWLTGFGDDARVKVLSTIAMLWRTGAIVAADDETDMPVAMPIITSGAADR